ncbi:hypothetical protein BGX31_005679 [Mortierella sp. GBA43]|nr:hypothetical protein BGX31_005679 [Mortierella sp. GBA43]
MPASSLEWDLHLAKAIFDINHRIVANTGVSPIQVLMGYVGQSALRRLFKDDILFSTTGASETATIDMAESVARFVCLREAVREMAYSNRLRANEKMKRYYDRRVRRTDFQVGELVYLFNLIFISGFGRKLAPRWLGPYEVVWAGSKGAFGIRTGRTHYGVKDSVETISGDMLKKFVARKEAEQRE